MGDRGGPAPAKGPNIVSDELADAIFRFGPDAPATAKPVDETAVPRSEEPEPLLGQARFGEIRVDFGEESFVHAAKIHALACRSIHAITFARCAPERATQQP